MTEYSHTKSTRLEFLKKTLKTKPFFIALGVLNILIFHYAIWRLFWFLYDSSGRQIFTSWPEALLINTSLILFFSAPHSILLNAKVKRFFFKAMPASLYSTFYSLHSCIAIIMLDSFWMDFGTGNALYQLQGQAQFFFHILYGASWLFMLWAMISTGLFRQSGIEEWYLALKGKKIKNSLATHGAYAFCRHPIYAAFIAMIWTSPNMTYDHLFLSLSWTLYILWGAGQKEKRLMRNKGYQRYANEVMAFPFINKMFDNFLVRILWRISL